MTDINTNLLTSLKIEHDLVLAEYLEAKKAMEGVPTPEKLKHLIVITARLAEIRKEMENEFPQA